MKNKITVPTVGALLLALCSSAQAQRPKQVPRIGYLVTGSASAHSARREAFQKRLRDLGYVEGQNIVIEYRYAEGKIERLPDLAAELVGLKVDVIVAGGHLQPVLPRRQPRRSPLSCRGAIRLELELSLAWPGLAET